MDFSQVKAITIPEGAVKQITDGLGRILWKEQDEGFKILIADSDTEWSGVYSNNANYTTKYFYLEYRNYDLVNNPGITFDLWMSWFAGQSPSWQFSADTYICANTVKTFSTSVPYIYSSNISPNGYTVTRTLYPTSKDGYLIIRIRQDSTYSYGITAFFKVTLVS